MKNALALTRELRKLGDARAPATLAPAVLERLGLADVYWRLESPVGPVFVAKSAVGISRVSRERSAVEFERAYRKQFGRSVRPAKKKAPADLRRWIREGAAAPEPRFDLRGLSEFERAVLTKALEIPRGQVRSYAWIAKEIGAPRAVRAAGTALAHNPVPLLIPCHRVVRSDGRIGHYSLGGDRFKRTILEAEGAHPELIERVAASGVRFLGNEQERYFCVPTCGGIASLLEENWVRFHSEREAREAGYRPCSACRPSLAA
jgi:O-6-methylguanine DNA methyltransferase